MEIQTLPWRSILIYNYIFLVQKKGRKPEALGKYQYELIIITTKDNNN